MQNTKSLMHSLPGCFVAVLALCLFAGCKTEQFSTEQSSTKVASTPPAATAAPATASVPAPVTMPVRIKAGLTTSFTDSDGNVWLADQGFADGDTTDRATDLQIANTKDPGLYRTEHYSMTSFSYPVPNGKYIVKLHFAETFDGITGPGERVFSFNVEGQEFKDFDVWAKAGGPNRAYIETVNVEVTDGKLNITFTPKVENPEINGIEIVPAS
ncbi:MAG: malectin [Verrucomicrobiota bacterium]